MSRKLPLSVTINKIQLKNFGNDSSFVGQSFDDYDGGTLYCHADPVPGGGIALTIDENGPSSFTATTGDVKTVTITYQANPPPAPPRTIAWNNVPAGNTYHGFPMEFNLVFADDLGSATFQLTQPAVGTSTEKRIGIIVIGKAITGASPMGYFVDVPVGADDPSVDVTNFSSIGIAWAPGGSFAGPIGSGTLP
jgi:hypothetical protein